MRHIDESWNKIKNLKIKTIEDEVIAFENKRTVIKFMDVLKKIQKENK